jgi:predicted acyl esterase
VYPNGEAHLIQDSAVRMRWRDGGVEPHFMEKGIVYPAYISLWNTSYVVAPGHSLRFAISSTNSPRFSVNPNNGLLLADPAYPGENVIATNTIHHSASYPSYIELPVVSKKDLPQLHNIKGIFQSAYPDVDYDAVMEKGPALLEKLSAVSRFQQ